jgi:CheY-like chemotaxis protein
MLTEPSVSFSVLKKSRFGAYNAFQKQRSNTVAKVMVVEDDPAIQNAYQFVFAKAGYDVLMASNGEEAMRQLPDLPDVILLDMLMPGFSGLDFLRAADVKEHYPKMKVVCLTNIESPKVKDEAMSLGADSYVIKVTKNPSELVTMVDEMVGSRPNEKKRTDDKPDEQSDEGK